MKYKKGKKAILLQPIQVKSIDKENFTLTMVASTQDEDRHGDTVLQSGWNLKNYLKNPVILNSHQYNDATEVIAKATRTEVVGEGKRAKLEQDWKFAVNENPKAKIIFDLYAGGFLNASSVGFIVRKFKENKDGTTDWFVIEEAELLEVSAVSVPANQRALAKEKGIDIDMLGKVVENVEDENNDTTDETTDPEQETAEEANADDEISEGDEVQGDDGGESTDNGDNSEDEQTESDESENTETTDTENQENEQENSEKVAVPYKQKVIMAIKNIESREVKILTRVAKIIKNLLENEPYAKIDEKKVQEQVRKRKVNQAIRALHKIK